jgi:predicted nucleic acid-binding protein
MKAIGCLRNHTNPRMCQVKASGGAPGAINVPRERVAEVLTGFLASGGLLAQESMLLVAALAQMAGQRVDVVNAYLAAKARLSGAPVATFDGGFDRLGVERLARDA